MREASSPTHSGDSYPRGPGPLLAPCPLPLPSPELRDSYPRDPGPLLAPCPLPLPSPELHDFSFPSSPSPSRLLLPLPVFSFPFPSPPSPSRRIRFILASDGVWDLWEYEDVFQGIVNPPSGGKQSTHVAKAFFNKSVERGAEIFDDTAVRLLGGRTADEMAPT